MLVEPETIERIGTLALAAAGVVCMIRAAFILIFRVPAKAVLTYDGYRRMNRERNAAIFLRERAPMPYTVQDAIAFETAEGEKIHVAVQRVAMLRDCKQLVWYSPRRPENISTNGPIYWFGLSLACFGSIVLLFYL